MIRLIIILVAGLTLSAGARTWTDASGKISVDGDFVDVANGTLVIRDKTKKERKLPLAKLSDKDFRFLFGQSRVRKFTIFSLREKFVVTYEGQPLHRNAEVVRIKGKLTDVAENQMCAVRTVEDKLVYVVSKRHASQKPGSWVVCPEALKLAGKTKRSPDGKQQLPIYLPVKEVHGDHLPIFLEKLRNELVRHMRSAPNEPKRKPPAVATRKEVKRELKQERLQQPAAPSRLLPGMRQPAAVASPEVEYVPPPVGAHFLDSDEEKASYRERLGQ